MTMALAFRQKAMVKRLSLLVIGECLFSLYISKPKFSTCYFSCDLFSVSSYKFFVRRLFDCNFLGFPFNTRVLDL